MKPFRTAIAFALTLASSLAGPALLAQQAHPTPQPIESIRSKPVAQPALWKVSDDDTTIYLFGTIHLLPKGIEWYDGRVANAFEQSQELVTEIPEVPQQKTMAVTMQLGALPAGQTLRGQMTPAERAKFEAALQSLSVPPSAFDQLKPWLASVAIMSIPLMQSGYSLDNGVEAQLDQRNKALGRPRLGLETLEYQLGIFDGLPNEAQKAYLFETVDALPVLTKEIAKMVEAWSQGDAQALAELLNDEMDDPVLYKALLSDRNRNWSQWIDDRLDRPGTVFIAVGAGHLGGRDSVQEFLGKAGIKVERVQ
ncbi:MAG: TraB/GumN family protein [Alphaproteobacteria bacterium]